MRLTRPPAADRTPGEFVRSWSVAALPLLVLSAEEAIRSVRSHSRWPADAEEQARRLSPIARPQFEPSFSFGREDPIFTIGSCFARNIEKHLLAEGYNVALKSFAPPDDPRFTADPEVLLHRYLPHSIENELRWAIGGEAFPEEAYLEMTPGGWYDPHIHVLVPPAPLELVKARRQAMADYFAHAGRARVFVVTLGLAEAWFDKQTGHYLNAIPPGRTRKLFPGRFEFHLLGPDEALASLERIKALLQAHGREDVQMLVTVSPVALSTTFAGGDVMAANTYMKSALRAAAEAFVRGNERADYFPSYESVVLSDRSWAWREDQAHASDAIVRVNVLRMLAAYAEDAAAQAQIDKVLDAYVEVEAARQAVKWKATRLAEQAYRKAVELAPDEGLVLLDYGRFLLERRRYGRAQPLLERAARCGAAPYGAWLYLGQLLHATWRYRQADEAAAKAREHHPARPGVLSLSASVAERLGRLEEALAYAEQHLALEPEAAGPRRRCERLRRKLKTPGPGPVSPAPVASPPEGASA
jgi:Tfp pilus assembly protein PilF